MDSSKTHQNQDKFIPATAIPIQITNVRSPYFMAMYEVKDYTQNIQALNKKLFTRIQSHILNSKNNDRFNLGDSVVACNKVSQDIDLPAWWCRGIIGPFDSTDMKYNVFLIDHGISVRLFKEDLVAVPSDFIPDKPLTSVIGIFNIIPVTTTKVDPTTISLKIVEKWPDKAIQFTKELIVASSTVYFDCMISDKCGKKYGELFLMIDDEILSISSTLVINRYAIYFSDDLLNAMKKTNGELEEDTNNTDKIYYIKGLSNNDLLKNVRNETNLQPNTTLSNANECRESISANHVYDMDKLTKKDNSMKSYYDLQEVLVYSKNACKCINSVADAQFTAKIHKVWDLMIRSSRSTKLQSYIWPAIKNSLNVVAIGSPGSGKTFGYIVAITSLLAAQNILPQGNKPSALILCASSIEAHSVYALCTEFLQEYDNIKSVVAFKGKPLKSIVAQVYNGCQILISTPCFLTEMMNENKNLINFENLSYLIFDNADIIMDKYFNSVAELFTKHRIIKNREWQSNNIPLLQIIAVARHWSPMLKKLVFTTMYNPYICIASFVEAIIFKCIRPKMYIVDSTLINQKIVDLLEDNCKLRTMIICTSAKEAEELYGVLSLHKSAILIHEKKNLLDIQDIKNIWEISLCDTCPILICTDEVLSDLNITDVDWLIHYSVSLEVKTKFNFRFSVLMDNLQKENFNCRVTIIVHENNNLQFLSILKLMQRMGIVIPTNILDNVQNIAISLDKCKKGYSLCENKKSFGFCSKENSCIFRHYADENRDAPMTNISKGDKIKFMLLYVHDATHFSARIIEHINLKTSKKVNFFKEDYIKVHMKIQNFYKDVNNRKKCTSVNVGDICILEESIENFKRVQVLHIQKDTRKHFNNTKFVDVRCIDTGIVLRKITIQSLLFIPSELLNLPIHVVEVYLANIVPCDNEYAWNNWANEEVHTWFAENFNEHSYIIGTVCLHLGNTFWINDLEIGMKLDGHPDLIGCSLKRELINKNHAVIKNALPFMT